MPICEVIQTPTNAFLKYVITFFVSSMSNKNNWFLFIQVICLRQTYFVDWFDLYIHISDGKINIEHNSKVVTLCGLGQTLSKKMTNFTLVRTLNQSIDVYEYFKKYFCKSPYHLNSKEDDESKNNDAGVILFWINVWIIFSKK